MLPMIASTSFTPIPTPLVNTAVPGSTVTHVPYDNVAPSVSSAEINNNTRGNSNTPVAVQEEATPAVIQDADGEVIPARTPIATSSVQTAFLAQLAAQDSSPASQTILVQYDKLLAISNVKYKPSNAFKPAAEPSGVFGRILVEEHAAPAVEAPPPVQVQQQAPEPAQEAPQQAPVEAVQNEQPVEQAARPSPAAISAYANSLARIETQAPEAYTELA